MITIFNRKELIITYDMAVQSKAREILSNNKIDYVIKVRKLDYNAFNPTTYEYKIYVHKKDYEYASYLTKDVFR